MRHREGDEQEADAQHQPGLVRVPERRHRRHHQLLLLAAGRRHQHGDAEVVAVEQHVGEDGEAHQRGEDQRQIHQPFRLKWVSVTI